MKLEQIKVKLDVGVKMPERAHTDDAGLDIFAPNSVILPAGSSATIDTGVHIEIPKGYVGLLKSKSGLNVRHSITGDVPRYIKLPQPEYLTPTAEKLYQSPIEIIMQEMQTQFDGEVFKATQAYGINVDKDELIKALQYDRDQYDKGFADGSRIDTTAIRAEVAREIFREIYAEIFEMFPLKVFHLIGGACVGESFESGKERALHDVLNCIAELEKKYTEGRND